MLTIEKVLILSEVDIFRGLSGESLSEVAAVAEEMEVAEGETIMAKGELCSTMYAIVTGSARVQDGDRVLAEYGRGQALGASSALDPGERSTTTTATEPCLLLKIEHEDLFDLISEDVDLAKAIIRSLSRRLKGGA